MEIIIPRNTLVLLCGPAGCGKSTFAAKHFFKTQIVSSDECRAIISDDPANQGVSAHAFDLFHFIIRKRLLLGRLTVADATNLKAEERRPLRWVARRFRFNAAAIVFNVPLETCLQRNAARDRTIPEEAIRNQYQLFEATLGAIESEGFDRVFILDPSAQSEAIVKITRPLSVPKSTR